MFSITKQDFCIPQCVLCLCRTSGCSLLHPSKPPHRENYEEHHTGPQQHIPAKGNATLWCFPAEHPVCPLLSKTVSFPLFSSAFSANCLIHLQAKPINVIFTAMRKKVTLPTHCFAPGGHTETSGKSLSALHIWWIHIYYTSFGVFWCFNSNISSEL